MVCAHNDKEERRTQYPSYRKKKQKSQEITVLTTVRVKVKFALEQAMKAKRGSRDIALLFL
jgi:hypothetical protein